MATRHSKLVIANWKANPDTLEEARVLAREIESAASKFKTLEVVVAPAFPHLAGAGAELKYAHLGAQDVFWAARGPYTGEVSVAHVKHLGVTHVILGHSERRAWLGETDAMINKKVIAAVKTGLIPVLCIGEPKVIRMRGFRVVKNYIAKQLKEGLRDLAGKKLSHLVIAYEPIWAIGTGLPDSPRDVAHIAQAIREMMQSQFHARTLKVLYGGSVTRKNVQSYMKEGGVDGALVGGASLNSKELSFILRSAA